MQERLLIRVTVAMTALLLCGTAHTAERVTYFKDVAPILQENCATCHRPAGANLSGMIAPMALLTYAEVRPWSKAIRKVVSTKEMPPWQASEKVHGQFRNERTLTQDQIDIIVTWVDQGATRGSPADAPATLPEPESAWTIGEPDLLVEFDQPYWVPDDTTDIQPFIIVTLKKGAIDGPKWVKAIEFKPGSEVVHHIVTFLVEPGESALDPRNQKLFGLIAPGTDPQGFDDGFGIELKPESSIGFAMHYHKEAGPGTGTWDSSIMALKFHDGPVDHPVDISPIAYGGFEIPPGHPAWKVGASWTWEKEFYVLGFMPHTHLRGSAARYTAFYPDGTTELLLDVPDYDYNWQTGYEYADYKPMPAGTRVEFELWYDNSPEKAAQAGFNSERAISFGGPTTDEMDLGWITTAWIQPGDTAPTRINLADEVAQNSGVTEVIGLD